MFLLSPSIIFQAEARLDDNELSLAPAPSRLHDTVGKPRMDSTYVAEVNNT